MRTTKILAFLALSLLADVALAQVDWRTDWTAAREEAARDRKLLFVAVHEVGELCNESFLTEVLRHRRCEEILRGVVPVLLLPPDSSDAALLSLLPNHTPGLVRQRTVVANRALFGPGATVTTPQQIVLHPEGGVLWHHIGACNLRQLEKAVAQARSGLRLKAKELASVIQRAAKALASAAASDTESAEKLIVLARCADDQGFAKVMAAVAVKRELVERVLSGAMVGLRRARAQQRVEALRSVKDCAALLPRAIELAHAALPDDPNVKVLEITAPLPALRGAEPLTAVRFADGVKRDLESNRVTVLWFFLPDAELLNEQLAAVAGVIDELEAQGAACYALAGVLEPDEALPALRAKAFPCPVGAYHYDEHQPFEGVRDFPAALVIDGDGQVVYDDSGPGVREYAGFAATARGLVRYLHTRRQATPPVR